MSSEFAHYITQYGYVAVFLLVFLQELGVPNPVTNEFVLLFSGYLAYSGVVNLWLVIVAAVSADCIGTSVLYAVSYRYGGYLIRRRPAWFPIAPERLDRMAHTISGCRWGIYIGRHIPFLRGYASVAAGVLSIRPRVFLPAVLLSAITWSGGYVVAGRLLGPYWEEFANRVGGVESAVLVAAVLIASALVGRSILRKRRAA